MIQQWKNKIDSFIELASKYQVRMIMVGGGAVNFHGYQRHSADVDFWIDTQEENFEKLLIVFRKMGHELTGFPSEVKKKNQNISVKFSPQDLNLELITNFSTYIPFEEAYQRSEKVSIANKPFLKWNVLSYEDLIESKLRAKRAKDLLDVQQLREIKNES